MKKYSSLLFAMFAVIALVFTSCNPDDDGEVDNSPMIVLNGGADYVSSDVTVEVGESLLIGITATPNAGTGEKLVGLTIVGTMDNIPETLLDSTLDKLTSFNMDLEMTAPETAGVARLVITITDNKGETAEKVINITTVAASNSVSTYTVTLGSYAATEGSSFASLTGTVYTSADAKANSEKVDVMYYYGATNNATLAAPSNADAASVFSWLADFTTKNATMFYTNTMTSADFDAITDSGDIIMDGTGASDVNGLSVGDIIVFKTASTSAHASKKGAIKVTAINGETSSGTISIEVVVED